MPLFTSLFHLITDLGNFSALHVRSSLVPNVWAVVGVWVYVGHPFQATSGLLLSELGSSARSCLRFPVNTCKHISRCLLEMDPRSQTAHLKL